MAYGGLLDILQGILGQQGQGYGQGSGQDQGNGLLAMMAQRQQGVPTDLATDNVYGQGLLGQAGSDRLLGADLGTAGSDRLGVPPADYSGGQGTDTLGLGGDAAAPAPAATATNTAAPAAQGGGFLSGLFGGGGGTSGGAGLGAGLGGWVQKNPAAIDALVTGFANIGNKNVGNPFLYGASQAAPEFKEQKARDDLEAKQEAMKSAMLKLGYPAELAAAAGKIPELGTTVISQALKPREAKDAKSMISVGESGQVFDPNTGKFYTAPGGGTSKTTKEINDRLEAGRAQGLTGAELQQYALTGKIPGSDALTTTDKRAILEADEQVQNNSGAIESLNTALSLNKQAFQGPLAGERAALGNLPVIGGLVDQPGSKATQQLSNVIIGNALTQLRATFGGAPTEGERQVLIDLQGAVNQPADVRSEIFARAKRLAEQRLKFNQEKADALRGRTYYKPGGGSAPGAGAGGAPTSNDPLGIR